MSPRRSSQFRRMAKPTVLPNATALQWARFVSVSLCLLSVSLYVCVSLLFSFLHVLIPNDRISSKPPDALKALDRQRMLIVRGWCEERSRELLKLENENEKEKKKEKKKEKEKASSQKEEKQEIEQEGQRENQEKKEAPQRKKVLLCEDISGGQEPVAIPVVNDVDDEPAPVFEYFSRNVGEDSPEVSSLLCQLESEGPAFHRGSVPCGINFLKGGWGSEGGWDPLHTEIFGNEYYLEMKHYGRRLKAFTPLGIHECLEGSGCGCGVHNQRVSLGVCLPLEVFKTQGRGYGLRCRVCIPEGTFIMGYYGEVLTESQAEGLKDSERFLYSLDHYFARCVVFLSFLLCFLFLFFSFLFFSFLFSSFLYPSLLCSPFFLD